MASERSKEKEVGRESLKRLSSMGFVELGRIFELQFCNGAFLKKLALNFR